MHARGLILLALTISPLLAAPIRSDKLNTLHRRELTLTSADAAKAKQLMNGIVKKLKAPGGHLDMKDLDDLQFIKSASKLKADPKVPLPNEHENFGRDSKAFFKDLRETRQTQLNTGKTVDEIANAQRDLNKINQVDPKTQWKEVMKPVAVVGGIGGGALVLDKAVKGRQQTVADGNGNYYQDHVDRSAAANADAPAPASQRRRSLRNALEELD